MDLCTALGHSLAGCSNYCALWQICFLLFLWTKNMTADTDSRNM